MPGTGRSPLKTTRSLVAAGARARLAVVARDGHGQEAGPRRGIEAIRSAGAVPDSDNAGEMAAGAVGRVARIRGAAISVVALDRGHVEASSVGGVATVHGARVPILAIGQHIEHVVARTVRRPRGIGGAGIAIVARHALVDRPGHAGIGLLIVHAVQVSFTVQKGPSSLQRSVPDTVSCVIQSRAEERRRARRGSAVSDAAARRRDLRSGLIPGATGLAA